MPNFKKFYKPNQLAIFYVKFSFVYFSLSAFHKNSHNGLNNIHP